MRKIALPVCLSLLLLFTFIIPAFAADMETLPEPVQEAVFDDENNTDLTKESSLNAVEDEVTVRVRVEGAKKSLADKRVKVSGTALDALKAAVRSKNVTAPDGYITAIKGETGKQDVAADTDTGWCYYVIRDGALEPSAFEQGAGTYLIKDGDEIVFYIGAYDTNTYDCKTFLPVVEISPQSPTKGENLTISITAQKYTWGVGLQELTDEETKAIGDFKVKVNNKNYTSRDGKAVIKNVRAGTLKYTITNASKYRYPDVVTLKGIVQVGR